MTVLNVYNKQPADRLDYDFDYEIFLAGIDTLETVEFTSEPAGLNLHGQAMGPTYAKVWVDGGVVNEVYKISCTVTTVHGRVKQDEIKIRVRDY